MYDAEVVLEILPEDYLIDERAILKAVSTVENATSG